MRTIHQWALWPSGLCGPSDLSAARSRWRRTLFLSPRLWWVRFILITFIYPILCYKPFFISPWYLAGPRAHLFPYQPVCAEGLQSARQRLLWRGCDRSGLSHGPDSRREAHSPVRQWRLGREAHAAGDSTAQPSWETPECKRRTTYIIFYNLVFIIVI